MSVQGTCIGTCMSVQVRTAHCELVHVPIHYVGSIGEIKLN